MQDNFGNEVLREPAQYQFTDAWLDALIDALGKRLEERDAARQSRTAELTDEQLEKLANIEAMRLLGLD